MDTFEESIAESEKFLAENETLGECNSNTDPGSQVDKKTCVHHWLIDSPHGTMSSGTCKICGEFRKDYFANSSENSGWAGPRRYPQKKVPRDKEREDKDKSKKRGPGRPKDGYINKISDEGLR